MWQSLTTIAALVGMALAGTAAHAQAAAPSNDIPAAFENARPEADFVRRVVMIPMRDGVKLHTIIFVPKGARNAPIVLTRTPYDAAGRSKRAESPSLLATLPIDDAAFVEGGYIRVYQDVRGKYGSEGDYVVGRPLRGPLNPTATDHATDAWDTIDWLVKNLPEGNGRVGMIGSSYEGFTAAMALIDPHPALKASVPESPLIDGWMGDDWFHYGAFRNLMLGYVQMQTAQRGAGDTTPAYIHDKYEELLRAGSTGDYARQHGLDKLPWVQRAFAHPAYDDYWQGQALDRLLAERPSTVPTLWKQGLWDQEDNWGANRAWLALKAAGRAGNNWLVLGPWGHSQENGTSLGVLNWEGDTARQYRREMVLPFFEQYLRGGPPAKLARVSVYNTGANRWERFADWPVACRTGCAAPLTPLYLRAGSALSFDRPADADGRDLYVSDPAKPVPFMPRPVIDPFFQLWTTAAGYEPWSKWLVGDQRFVDGRTDVLSYETPVLDAPVHVQGIPVADIIAATTGSDGDFVVKLIDVYPASHPETPALGGYQLPIAMDIFRGRYRESFSAPSAIPANVPQRYRFDLPNVNHVFQPGHRIMIQIQSSLFPLYDRNPQSFVPNIFFARPEDYRAATVSILRSADHPTAVWLPVVKTPAAR